MDGSWAKELEELRQRFEELRSKSDELAREVATDLSAVPAKDVDEAATALEAALGLRLEAEAGPSAPAAASAPAPAAVAPAATEAAAAPERAAPTEAPKAAPAATEGDIRALDRLIETAEKAAPVEAARLLQRLARAYARIQDPRLREILRERASVLFDRHARRLHADDRPAFERFCAQTDEAVHGTDLLERHPLARAIAEIRRGAAAEAPATAPAEAAAAPASADAADAESEKRALETRIDERIVGRLLRRFEGAPLRILERLKVSGRARGLGERMRRFARRFESKAVTSNFSVLERLAAAISLPDRFMNFDRRFKMLGAIFPEGVFGSDGASLMDVGRFAWILGADLIGTGTVPEGYAALAGVDRAALVTALALGAGPSFDLEIGELGLGGFTPSTVEVRPGPTLEAPRMATDGARLEPGPRIPAAAALPLPPAAPPSLGLSAAPPLPSAAIQALAALGSRLPPDALRALVAGKLDLRALAAAASGARPGGELGLPGLGGLVPGVGRLDHLALGFQSLSIGRMGLDTARLLERASFGRLAADGASYLAASSASFVGLGLKGLKLDELAKLPAASRLDLPSLAGLGPQPMAGAARPAGALSEAPSGYWPLGLKTYYASLPSLERSFLGLKLGPAGDYASLAAALKAPAFALPAILGALPARSGGLEMPKLPELPSLGAAPAAPAAPSTGPAPAPSMPTGLADLALRASLSSGLGSGFRFGSFPAALGSSFPVTGETPRPASVPSYAIATDGFGIPRFTGGSRLPVEAARLAGVDLTGSLVLGGGAPREPETGLPPAIAGRLGVEPLLRSRPLPTSLARDDFGVYRPGPRVPAEAPAAGAAAPGLAAVNLGSLPFGLRSSRRLEASLASLPGADIGPAPTTAMPPAPGALPRRAAEMRFALASVAPQVQVPGPGPAPAGEAEPARPASAMTRRPAVEAAFRAIEGEATEPAFRPRALEKYYGPVQSERLALGRAQSFELAGFAGARPAEAAVPGAAPDFAPRGLDRLAAAPASAPAGGETPWGAFRASRGAVARARVLEVVGEAPEGEAEKVHIAARRAPTVAAGSRIVEAAGRDTADFATGPATWRKAPQARSWDAAGFAPAARLGAVAGTLELAERRPAATLPGLERGLDGLARAYSGELLRRTPELPMPAAVAAAQPISRAPQVALGRMDVASPFSPDAAAPVVLPRPAAFAEPATSTELARVLEPAAFRPQARVVSSPGQARGGAEEPGFRPEPFTTAPTVRMPRYPTATSEPLFPQDVLDLAGRPHGLGRSHAPARVISRLSRIGLDTAFAPAPAGEGRPLDAAARARIEPLVGRRAAEAARIHEGGAGGEAAAHLGSPAIASGRDVHFRRGDYRPATPHGMEVLAHEVAHTRRPERPVHRFVDKLSEPGEAEAKRVGEEAREMLATGRRPDPDVVYGYLPRKVSGRFEDRLALEGFRGTDIRFKSRGGKFGFDARSAMDLDVQVAHDFVRFPGRIGDFPATPIRVDLSPDASRHGTAEARGLVGDREAALSYGARDLPVNLKGVLWGRKEGAVGEPGEVSFKTVDFASQLRAYDPRRIEGGLDIHTPEGLDLARYRVEEPAAAPWLERPRAGYVPPEARDLRQPSGDIAWGGSGLRVAGHYRPRSTLAEVSGGFDADVTDAGGFTRHAPGREVLPGSASYFRATGLDDERRLERLREGNESAVRGLVSEYGRRSPGRGFTAGVEARELEPASILRFKRTGDPSALRLSSSSPVLQRARSERGQPLSPAVLDFMERYFRRDLSGVRVHSSPTARQLNRQLDSEAFAVGQDVFVAKTHYANETDALGILGHEIAHIVHDRARDAMPEPSAVRPARRDAHVVPLPSEAERRARAAEQEIRGLLRDGPRARRTTPKLAMTHTAITHPGEAPEAQAPSRKREPELLQKRAPFAADVPLQMHEARGDRTMPFFEMFHPRAPQQDLTPLVYTIWRKIKQELAIENERRTGGF